MQHHCKHLSIAVFSPSAFVVRVQEELDIVFKQAHRWGAAFPTKQVSDSEHFESLSLNYRKQDTMKYATAGAPLLFCGDYSGKLVARVEGAVMSGLDAANRALNELSVTSSL